MSAPANLDFELAPAPSVVFGCLLPAPWVGIAAGLLLAFGPVEGLPHRFAPLSLALVHVVAVGMLLPVMLGALFQLLPVLAGVPVPAARHVSPLVAPCCIATAAGLAWGFIGGDPRGFSLAGGVALAGLGTVALLLAIAGRRVAVVNPSTRVLRRVGWALAATLALGAALAGVFGYGWALPLATLLDLHLAWGLGGWLAVLLAGVAATVLPMFWQAPRPSAVFERLLPWAVWLPLLAGFAELAGQLLPWRPLALLALAALAAIGCYAVLAARRRHDPAWPLWLAAAFSWLAAALLGLAAPWLPAAWPLPWWIGVLALVGGGVLPVNAMLGKIIPFLAWLHLRKRLPARVRVPPMQALLPPAVQRVQVGLVLLAWAGLLALPLAPDRLAGPAGIAFAVSQGLLGGMLLHVLGQFVRLRPRG
ncbi:hypothetical protein [Chitinimonas koreensis]|uniref:hypothetical protein n=1 Tax=Chitinimonas koreensis TaxID=356302 RepID=UPI0003F7E96E|nr:hypothetical protein [Chitinimonas koreensis]QNM95141.1 hypothetical protein H9L41_14780 [Chitinimonas koreensis]